MISIKQRIIEWPIIAGICLLGMGYIHSQFQANDSEKYTVANKMMGLSCRVLDDYAQANGNYPPPEDDAFPMDLLDDVNRVSLELIDEPINGPPIDPFDEQRNPVFQIRYLGRHSLIELNYVGPAVRYYLFRTIASSGEQYAGVVVSNGPDGKMDFTQSAVNEINDLIEHDPDNIEGVKAIIQKYSFDPGPEILDKHFWAKSTPHLGDMIRPLIKPD